MESIAGKGHDFEGIGGSWLMEYLTWIGAFESKERPCHVGVMKLQS